MLKKIAVIVVILAVAGWAIAQDWEYETGPVPCRDVAGVSEVKGIGVADLTAGEAQAIALAIRAAKLDAGRNAVEQFKGMLITSNSTAEKFKIVDDTIMSWAKGQISDFFVAEEKYRARGNQIEARVILRFCTTQCECDKAYIAYKKVVEKLYQPETQKAEPSVGRLFDENIKFKPEETVQVTQRYTSLIIDATTVDVKPAIAPSVWSEGSKLVYGLSIADKQEAMKYGLVHYASSIDNAKQLPYAGTDPLVVKAVKADGADVYLTDKDAGVVVASDMQQSYLKQCKVIIVLGLRQAGR